MNEIIEIDQIVKRWDELMIESGDRVTISSLQFTYGVGYTVAARTMDKLEELGMVEFRPHKGYFRN